MRICFKPWLGGVEHFDARVRRAGLRGTSGETPAVVVFAPLPRDDIVRPRFTSRGGVRGVGDGEPGHPSRISDLSASHHV